METSQTLHSRALFVQARNLCSKTINHAKTSFVNHINNKIAWCQTGSRSFWSLAKVVSQNFCHSSFPPLKNNFGSSSSTPSSKANLFAPTFTSNLYDQESQPPLYPTSTLTMPPIKFSTRKVRKALLQLNTSKSSGPDGIPAIVLKSCALNSLLSSTSFFNFPTILVFLLPLGNSPTFSLSPKKVTNLTLQTTALLQSLPSSLSYGDQYHQTTDCLP